MVFKCCVPSCKNDNHDAQMHIFPKDPSIYDVWIQAIGRVDLKDKPKDQVRKSYRICDVHFSNAERYIGSRYKSTIKQDAIPSLFLTAAEKVDVSNIIEEAVKAPESIPSTSSLPPTLLKRPIDRAGDPTKFSTSLVGNTDNQAVADISEKVVEVPESIASTPCIVMSPLTSNTH